MYCTGLTTSGPVSFAVLAADRRAGKPKDGGKQQQQKKTLQKFQKNTGKFNPIFFFLKNFENKMRSKLKRKESLN